MKDYFDLIWTFFKMGCVTFGGGYAMLPIIERELVVKKQWATMDEVMDYFAVGQVTPGIIAVNVATFIGYKRKGNLGGILTTLGFVLPSLIIITIIAAFLQNFSHIEMIQHVLAGIRVAVGALILDAVIKLFRGGVKDFKAVIICIAAFVLSAFFKTSPVLIVLTAGLAGFLLYFPRKSKEPEQ
ncbi:chromate transporter [Breznakiella homolactica]|uniref:Chromate transporter n=1 Tax=Breznakiella homolactica TaxID=2798577 RepID=A0A7T7XNG6_9SPIR|nr:chromate transporter [Breznakiella homolactica]QQO09478.1 chromate transporter [Breznakiella homolactica]